MILSLSLLKFGLNTFNTMSSDSYFPNSHAFIIGIDAYEQVAPLRTAVNDAERLAEVLERQHHYQNIQLLLNAKQEALEHLLKVTLAQMVQAGDKVLFYFAGHGIALDAETEDDPKPRGFLVPADADPNQEKSFIPMDLLNQQLMALEAKHVMLILDCCFSGSFEWSSNRTRAFGTRVPKKIYQERFDRYIKDPAWQVITSAAQDQKALDILSKRPLGERGEDYGKHSPFALALFEALDGAADLVPADDIDGIITASELYIFMRDKVEQASINEAEKLRQTPRFFHLPKHDKGEFIFFHPHHPLNLDPIPQRNPYKGLQSYNENEQELFYGREKVIASLQLHCKQQRLLVVTGASGTGKSSVVKAGLIPQLRSEGYRILPTFRPGKQPISAFQEALREVGIHLPILQDGKPNPALMQALTEKPSVILIDQYEELITQTERSQYREDLLKFLQQILSQEKADNLRIIITVRSDFEPQFEKLFLGNYWQQARFTVPPFSQNELREVIEKPAIQEVLSFDPPELVDKIINEVIQAPGALPLLSFLLSELYLKCYQQGRKLTQTAYEELGGVIGALRSRADAIYESLDEAEKRSMRHLMLRMVSLEGGETASRRVLLEELEFSQEAENQRLQKIIQELAQARLIVQGKDISGQAYIEPAHDALVRAWGKLWEWIRQFGEDNIALQRRLNEAVLDLKAFEK